MTSLYLSRLKISVTFMFRPSLIIWRIAGTPASVAGILTSKLGIAMRSWKMRASLMVPSVS